MSREARLHRLKRMASPAKLPGVVTPGGKHRQLPSLLPETKSNGHTGMVRVRFGYFDTDLMVVNGRLNYDDCLELWGGIIAVEFRHSDDMRPFLITPTGEVLPEKDGSFDGIEGDGEHTLALRDPAMDAYVGGGPSKEVVAQTSFDASSFTAGITTTPSDDATANFVVMEAMAVIDARDETTMDENSEHGRTATTHGSQPVSIALPTLGSASGVLAKNPSFLEEDVQGSNDELKWESMDGDDSRDGGSTISEGERGVEGREIEARKSDDYNFREQFQSLLQGTADDGEMNPLQTAMLMMPAIPPVHSPRPYEAERVIGCGVVVMMVLNSDTSRRKLVFVKQPTSTKQLGATSTRVLGLKDEAKTGVKFLDGITGEVIQPGDALKPEMEVFVCTDKEELFSGIPPNDHFWRGPPPEEDTDDEELFVGGPLRVLRDYILDYIKPMVKRDRTKLNWDAANNHDWRGLTIDKDLGVIRRWVLPCVNLDIDIDFMKPILGEHLDTFCLAGNVNLKGGLGILGRQCPNLRVLNINNTAIEGDIDCLRGLGKLEKLDITGCTHITGMLPVTLARRPGLECFLRNSGVKARASAAEQREWLFDQVKLKIEALLYWKQFAQYHLPPGKGSQFMDYGNVNWEIESFGQWYGITFLAGADRSASASMDKVERPGFYIPDAHFAGQRDNKRHMVSEYEHGDALGEGLVSKIWLPNVGLRADIGPDLRPLYTEHLVVINLERNPDTTGNLLAIGERCPRIRVLRLGRTQCYGDIETLAECASLVELDLEKCGGIRGTMPRSLLENERLECNIEGTSIVMNKSPDMHRGLFKFTIIESEELLDLERFESYEEASPRLKEVRETYKECQSWRFSRILSAKKKTWNGNLVEDKFTRNDIAFVSHRWLRRDHPDDAEGSKLKHLQMLARQHPEIRAWWVDFLCVPQTTKDQAAAANRQAALVSVGHYIKCCGTFFVLVNDEHANPRYHFKGPESWQAGGWPRLERLAACASLMQRDSARGDKPLKTRIVVSHARGKMFDHHVGSSSTNGSIEESLDVLVDPEDYDPADGKFSDDNDDSKPSDQKDRQLTDGLRRMLLEMLQRDFATRAVVKEARDVPMAGFSPVEELGTSTEQRVTGGHHDSDEEEGEIMPLELREKPAYPDWYKEVLVKGYEKAERWEVRTFDRGKKFHTQERERAEKWARVL